VGTYGASNNGGAIGVHRFHAGGHSRAVCDALWGSGQTDIAQPYGPR